MRTSLPVVVLLVLAMACIPAGASVAQDAPATMVITGFGNAGKEPISADLEFVFTGVQDFSGMPATPIVEDEPGAAARLALEPVLNAVSAVEGVADAVATVPVVTDPYRGLPTLGRINLTLERPTQENVLALVSTVSQAAAKEGFFLRQVGARFYLSDEDCRAIIGFAHRGAIANAQEQAGWLEGRGGVQLGEIVSIEDAPYAYESRASMFSGCGSAPGVQFFGDPMEDVTLPPFNPNSDQVMVWVTSTVLVTFALESVEPLASPAA